jgi:hypothetical protein
MLVDVAVFVEIAEESSAKGRHDDLAENRS